MTQTLTHDNETMGEWSDDMIVRIAAQLKKSKSKDDSIKKEATRNIVAEFLPDQIRDAFLSQPKKGKESKQQKGFVDQKRQVEIEVRRQIRLGIGCFKRRNGLGHQKAEKIKYEKIYTYIIN